MSLYSALRQRGLGCLEGRQRGGFVQAMCLEKHSRLAECESPLAWSERSEPQPGAADLVVRIAACGVCRTELDEIEARRLPRLPVVPGHQVVGRVEAKGARARGFEVGDRVGVAWIHSACGRCEYCSSERENLCPDFVATGCDVDGGYAEALVVPAAFAHAIPPVFSDAEAAPLLCAGAIGYRALRLTGLRDGQSLGLTGFGASAHLVLKMVRGELPKARVFVFARHEGERQFARELGAVWAGDTETPAPEMLHAVIDTTPAWRPVVAALANLRPGGKLVINAIRKEDGDKEHLLQTDYTRHLWMERTIQSAANVTRADVRGCLELAARLGLRPEVQEYPLRDANRALRELAQGKIRGAKVLRVG